ncbi:hypothetical protein SEA_DAUBENSKI_73 [Streptomyces phage Daubenski]|uniref:MerR-like helix-turn-helix DNA binding domain protein n=1 Tax=Streptomyces phage Daubenski TaxID=2653725 RepID=A0A5Q2WD73_9CAUD|nr:hypothetical protein KNU80_gp193 [Streptomyces phage Daubenski]QGH76381.1 hypothetical protein SEA_DAUBENSKI_73 [Streptomyces phage Daubenski]
MGKKKGGPRKAKKYFFLDGIPHKKLQVNHGADILIAWNYVDKKSVAYVWSVARRNMGRAFLGPEVQKMLGRHRNSLRNYITQGQIREPYKTYSLDGRFSPGMYLWSEKDILDLHEMLVHRKYGALPSRAELLAMMRNDVVLYTKTRDGEFTPVWQEKDW